MAESGTDYVTFLAVENKGGEEMQIFFFFLFIMTFSSSPNSIAYGLWPSTCQPSLPLLYLLFLLIHHCLLAPSVL